MKQVVFAVLLMAMASLTGCLNEEDSPVDEKTDTTDDSTSDTTEDNSDTTEDNSDTTDDTKDDELIEPVGQTGDTTIPEDSSVFIDQSSSYSEQGGKWDCSSIEGYGIGDTECDFIYHGDDYFSSDIYPSYYDADFITNAFDFNGWVNKTGETVTIEGLYFPERSSYIREYETDVWTEDEQDYLEYPALDYTYLGKQVSNSCQKTSSCGIIFYGHGGLMFSAEFTLSPYPREYTNYVDTDEDGAFDLVKRIAFYEHFTVTFDLPFEPYGFSLIYNDAKSIDRIF